MNQIQLPTLPLSPLTCYLYHERQYLGMCGVHTINCLVQWPRVTPHDLFEVAKSIDRAELDLIDFNDPDNRKLLANQQKKRGNNNATTRNNNNEIDYTPGELTNRSQNFNREGNFSLQVVMEALRLQGFDCNPLNNEQYSKSDVARDFSAFVVNYQTHWFLIRKVLNTWYDFNSFLSQPVPISDTNLRAYLDELRRKNYFMFIVQGKIPEVRTEPPVKLPSSSHGRWIPALVGCAGNAGLVLRDAEPLIISDDVVSNVDQKQLLAEVTLSLGKLHQMTKVIDLRLKRLEKMNNKLDNKVEITQALTDITPS